MKKVSVVVDQNGDLHVDLSGYENNACVEDEVRIRAVLAELGLTTRVDNIKEKNTRNNVTVTTNRRTKL